MNSLDIMHFIVERFTSFFLKLSFSQPLLLLFNRYLLNHARGITRWDNIAAEGLGDYSLSIELSEYGSQFRLGL